MDKDKKHQKTKIIIESENGGLVILEVVNMKKYYTIKKTYYSIDRTQTSETKYRDKLADLEGAIDFLNFEAEDILESGNNCKIIN